MAVPPGILYFFQNFPSITLPPALVYIGYKFSRTQLNLILPVWTIIAAVFLSFPLAIFLRVTYTKWRISREAAAHGAILPPEVHDSWPGGLGLLAKSIENLKTGYPGDLFYEWGKTYGHSFSVKLLFESRFVTTEPEYIKAILASQFDKFEKGHEFDTAMKTVLGTGVFNSDGDMWKFHRAITRPFFSKDRISHFDIFDRHANDALHQLKVRLREGYPVDIQDLASRFTMDSATEFLFASDVCSLAAGLPYPHYSSLAKSSEALNHPANKFSRAFDEAQKLTALRSRSGRNWPLTEFWKDKVAEQMAVVHDFINPILSAAVQRQRENGSKAQRMQQLSSDRDVKEGETLLDHLINYTDDETVLRDEILNILLAGRDTTTNTITFAVYMLAENPHVFRKLREEILEKVGPTRRPTFDDMRNMKYLRAVINETLRLYPAVPFNIRTTSKPVILPSTNGGKPFYLPANNRILYSIFMMHRRSDLWGPDVHEFDPERFIDDRVRKYLTPNPFIFLPFNAGPRICLGQQFAYHEISFFLIRLMQQFSSISHVFEAQPLDARPSENWKGAIGTQGRDKIRMKSALTMSVVGGCWVKMEEANVLSGLESPI